MSPSFWWNSQDFNTTILQSPPHTGHSVHSGAYRQSYKQVATAQASPEQVFYLDSGNQDGDSDIYGDTITVRDTMVRKWGFELGSSVFYYLDDGGEHNELYWGRRFHIPMATLYPPP
jgi:hypothetical protein